MYETFDEVKMENKFAPVFMTIPLLQDAKEAIAKVSKVTKALKKTFPQIYFLFVVSKYSSYLLPDFLMNRTSENLTKKFTLAFSNTPGMLQPIEVRNSKSTSMATAVIPAGKCGICVSIISFYKDVRVTVLADSGLMTQTEVHQLGSLIERAIQNYIKLSGNVKIE